ncbi:TonB-dependent receptor [Paraglaciecola hydrolytica]|uniref:TonB-dependent receptor n=1 Tax=Paraglaciecola hydrolytica TaxID=1799789 RepID=A0A136A293_9ALTE|nr:TonB-dependent receptor [Paraglaciecola hydrolytica]KXI29260.1 TonB-dependent receptor [Paraglaciecola hydrolytica]
MLRNTKLNRIAIAVAMSMGMATAAFAQETSSGISGKIVGPQGTPAAGTVITITHIPSGTVKTTTVNAAGQFSAKGLRVGGPYKVTVDSNQYQDTTVSEVYLNLGEVYGLDLSLEADQQVESIVVTGSSLSSSAFGDTGPAANFNLADLENAPSINRDINDVIRADPRIYIDESFNDAVQCAGASPRYNSLTLDGVRMNDNFGLNSNGYPTERMPFSFDAIEQVTVELAPFDVQYGGFTACNINAVTKSGTNEVHGSAFFDYTSDSFKGDSVEGEKQDNGNYTEKRYGVNVGFPLISDTLFGFFSYEKVEGVQLFSYDALGSRVTQAEVDQVTSIAQSVYGYDVGGMPGSAPVEDEKILVKLDWNINEDHRASLVYNWNDGFSLSQSDSGSSVLPLSNHYYERGAELTSVVASLYSDWTADFSTELRIGSSKLENRQNSIDAASGFAEAQISTASGTIYIGPDDSRQSNELNYDTDTFKLAATYYMDNHKISGGIEYEKLDVFNLFMQHTVGEYRFRSIADFEAGKPNAIYYNNSAGTNNPADAGASFANTTTTLYVQDDFDLTDDIQMMVGLRYDKFSTDDTPTLNQNFQNRYGFANTGTVDGMDLIQPRIGFNWRVQDNLEVRGGVGRYSGGNPNVWISNAYSNDGVTNIEARQGAIPNFSASTLFNIPLTGQGRPIYDIPQAMFDVVANTSITSGDGGVNATDPDFKMPHEWKFAIGGTFITEDDYLISADLMYTKKKDSPILVDLALTDSGADAPDGRPIYGSNGRFDGSDLLLTNVKGSDGDSKVLSLAVSKDYDFGLDASLAYAFTRSTDVNPMTSSTAGSNFGNVAVSDLNNPGVATSDYETRHRFTMTLSYKHEFIDGYDTKFSLFGTANEGKPISYTYNNEAMFRDSNDYRSLIYVPLENDPNVVYEAYTDPDTGVVTPFDLDGFNKLIDDEGLTRGSIMGRNSSSADWWVKFDVRVEQELPAFFEGHKASAFFVVENLGNLLNDDWGVFRQGSFVGDDVIAAYINDQGQYVYNRYLPSEQGINRGASLWEVRMGVKYRF